MIETLFSNQVVDGPVAFLGEVPSSKFITGNTLAAAVGLTTGIERNSNEPWLRFYLDGAVLYMAKKALRTGVSWNTYNAKGLVNGTATVSIAGRVYKVRMPKGSTQIGPHPGNGIGYDIKNTWGSEWNRLMYPLVAKASGATNPVSEEGIVFGSMAQYTEAELGMGDGSSPGCHSWCQEYADISSTRVCRGRYSVRYIGNPMSTATDSVFGWRPVLELVS